MAHGTYGIRRGPCAKSCYQLSDDGEERVDAELSRGEKIHRCKSAVVRRAGCNEFAAPPHAEAARPARVRLVVFDGAATLPKSGDFGYVTS